MFRFTIGDVLWLTVVVGLISGWFLTIQFKDARYRYLLDQYNRARDPATYGPPAPSTGTARPTDNRP
jgi:hypothetical protein